MEVLERGLHRGDVARVGGAHEVVVLHLQPLHHRLPVDDHVVDVGLRGHAALLGLLEHLLAVLVDARHQEDLPTAQLLASA